MPKFEEAVPATLAVLAIGALTASHWLQLSDPATTAFVGLLAGAGTLYFINKPKPVAGESSPVVFRVTPQQTAAEVTPRADTLEEVRRLRNP